MDKEFLPYQQALELKELGFDEPCFTFYPKEGKMGFDGKYHSIKDGYKNSTVNDIWIKKYGKNFELQDFLQTYETFPSHIVAAPTFSQAFRFFREKYGLHSYIEPVLVEKANSPIKYDYVILEVSHQNDLEYNNLPYHTFEEAELECLKKLIEIVKQ